MQSRPIQIINSLILLFICIGTITHLQAQSVKVRCFGMVFEFDSIPEIETNLSEKAEGDSVLFLKTELVSSEEFCDWNEALWEVIAVSNAPEWCVIPLIDSIYTSKSPVTRLVIQYASLELKGFWLALFLEESQDRLAVWTSQIVVWKPYKRHRGKSFLVVAEAIVDASEVLSQNDSVEIMSFPWKTTWGKRSFNSFADRIPDFEETELVQDSIWFFFQNAAGQEQDHVIHFDIYQPWLRLLEVTNTPDHRDIRRVLFSDQGKSRLLAELGAQMPKDNVEEALNFLLAFTSIGIKYQTDEILFGEERPLVPERTIAYQVGDCEDKVYLFDFLVRELLGLDVVFIHYPNHLAAAVDLNKDIGEVVHAKGKTYSICDPTGTAHGAFKMGERIQGFPDSKPEVILPYKKRPKSSRSEKTKKIN